MVLVGHVAHMIEMRNSYKTLDGKPEGKRHVADLGIGRKIVLTLILKIQA